MSTQHLPTNSLIADMLEEIAGLLAQQKAKIFKVIAYQKAANLIRTQTNEIAAIVNHGNGKTLEALPGIGPGISRLIIEFVKTGKSQLLLKLRGAVNAEDLFEDIPGIGEELAEHIVKELDIHSLEELEQAAHDGRLEQVKGFGKQRVEAIQLMLAGMLSSSVQRRLIKTNFKEKTNWEQPERGKE